MKLAKALLVVLVSAGPLAALGLETTTADDHATANQGGVLTTTTTTKDELIKEDIQDVEKGQHDSTSLPAVIKEGLSDSAVNDLKISKNDAANPVVSISGSSGTTDDGGETALASLDEKNVLRPNSKKEKEGVLDSNGSSSGLRQNDGTKKKRSGGGQFLRRATASAASVAESLERVKETSTRGVSLTTADDVPIKEFKEQIIKNMHKFQEIKDDMSSNEDSAAASYGEEGEEPLLILSQPDYIGCYKDTPDRALPHYVGNNIPAESCFATCKELGYEYAGRQWQQSCFCGNGDGYKKYGPSSACTCDSTSIGHWVNCVYKVKEENSCDISLRYASSSQNVQPDAYSGYECVGLGLCRDANRKKYDSVLFSGTSSMKACGDKCLEVRQSHPNKESYRGFMFGAKYGKCRCHYDDGKAPTNVPGADKTLVGREGNGRIASSYGAQYAACFSYTELPRCSIYEAGMQVDGFYYSEGGKWGICQELCRKDSKCNSWMGRNSGNTCYLSTAKELKPCNTNTGCNPDRVRAHTFNAKNCLPRCSKYEAGMVVDGSYYSEGGKWGVCEELCRKDSKCNSWMGRNSGNTCYLSTAKELKPCSANTGCNRKHAYTFNVENCE